MLQRMENWQRLKQAKVKSLARALDNEEQQRCTFRPQMVVSSGGSCNSGGREGGRKTGNYKRRDVPKAATKSAQAAMGKHLQRLQDARKKNAEKNKVPHATGRRWTGKPTTPVAPHLSYQKRSKKNCRSASETETPTSVKKNLHKTRVAKSSCMQRGARGGGPPFASCGRDASKQYEALGGYQSCVRAEQETSEPMVSLQSDVAHPNLADELVRLRNELRREEQRREELLSQRESRSDHNSVPPPPQPPATPHPDAGLPLPSSFAEPAQVAVESSGRSYKQSPTPPVPLGGMLGEMQVGPSIVELSQVMQSNFDYDAFTAGDENCMGNNNSQVETHPSPVQKKMSAGQNHHLLSPDWAKMKATMQQETLACKQKRESMLERLRSLEARNLEILGVDAAYLASASKLKTKPSSVSSTPSKASIRSMQKHVLRGSKASASQRSSSIRRKVGTMGTSKRTFH